MAQLIVRSLSRQPSCLLKQTPLIVTRRTQMKMSAYEEMSRFWKVNRQLKRPLSPFLTVYKPHLAMMTSLVHRITGIAMMVSICGTSILLLCVPGDFKTNLAYLKQLELPPVVWYAVKYVFAFPVSYHFINGLRHLAWDGGFGYGLKTLYKSAYFMMAMTFLVSSYFVFGLKPSVDV